MMMVSGSSYQTTGYYPGVGGPTIVQDAVPRTQFDVDIYKLKAKQEIDIMKLRFELDQKQRKEVWNLNKEQLLTKLDALNEMVREVRELIYV